MLNIETLNCEILDVIFYRAKTCILSFEIFYIYIYIYIKLQLNIRLVYNGFNILRDFWKKKKHLF